MEKVKGKLFMSEREIEYFRGSFVEGAQMMGRSGKLYQVKSQKQVNTDTYYEYEEPVDVSYYLVENPKKGLLQRYGWYRENPDYKPVLCSLPFKDNKGNDIEPTEGAIVEVSGRAKPHSAEYETRKFDVVNIYTDYDMNVFMCNLTPHRDIAEPVQPEPIPTDPLNENRWFDRKLLGEDDVYDNSGQ